MNEVVNDKEFNHIKIHTQYSICEGAVRTADLAKYCKDNKIKAAGLSDSNNLCGALEFSELLAKSKTQPIIGSQINVKHKENFGKIPLFASNLQGYKNLIKLSSKSFLGSIILALIKYFSFINSFYKKFLDKPFLLLLQAQLVLLLHFY